MRKLRLLTGTAIYRFIFLCFLLTCVIPPGALAAPLVAITSPGDGSTVSGETWIDVSYRGEQGLPVVAIQLYVDGRQVQQWRLTTPQVQGKQSFKWNFNFTAGETHVISAKAIDAQGAEANATITVRVAQAQATADNIPPVIKIYYPAQGAKLSDNVKIKAEATDNVGVTEVFFYLDGKLKAMIMNAPPYVTEWDTTKAADGPHVLQASAWDEAENEGRSAEVTVFVENRSLTSAATGLPPAEAAPAIEIPTSPEAAGLSTTPPPAEATAVSQAAAPEITWQPRPEIALPSEVRRPVAAAGGPALAMRPTPPIVPVIPTTSRFGAARSGSPASGAQLTALPPTLSPVALATRTAWPSRPALPAVVSLPEVAPQVQPAPQQRGGPGLALAMRPVTAATAAPPVTAQVTAAPGTMGAEKLTKPWYGTPRLSISPARNAPPSREIEVAAIPLGLPVARPQASLAPVESAESGYQVAMLPRTQAPQGIQPRTDTPTATVSPPTAIAEIRDVQIVFNSEQLDLRTLPETQNGISLAPLREIFEHTDGVLYWYPVEKKVRAVNEDVDLRLQIGSQQVQVNEETRTLALAPYIKQGRTMVPLQFLAEALDVTITYNPDSGQIVISSNEFWSP